MCSLLLPQLKAMSPGRGLQIVGGCILGQRSHLLLAEGPPVCSTIIHHHNSRRLWVPLPLNKPELYIQETVLLLSASVLSMANVFLRRDTIFFLNRVMTVFYFLLFKFFTYLVFAFQKSMITFVSVQSILHEYTSALHSDFTRVL